MNKNRVTSSIGGERLEKLIEELEGHRKNVGESELRDEEKKKLDRSLGDAIDRLTMGTIVERLSTMNTMERGEDPTMEAVKKAFADRMVEGLREEKKGQQPGDVLVNRLMERLADNLPIGSGAEGRDAVRGAVDEVVAEAVKHHLGTALSPVRQEDPILEAVKEQVRQMVADGIARAKEPPRGLAEQMTEAIKTYNSFRETMGGLGAGLDEGKRSADLEKQRFDLDIKRMEMDERLGIHRINLELAVERAKAEGMSKLVDMVGGGIDSIGRSLGRAMMDGSLASPSGPGRAQPSSEPTEQTMDCPGCGQRAVHVSAEQVAQVRAGGVVDVRCQACGVSHTLGGPATSARPMPGRQGGTEEEQKEEGDEEEFGDETMVSVAR